jgi:hypothetical protein
MATHVTGIGPLGAHAKYDGQRVNALIVAMRWDDSSPDRIEAYLVRLAAGPPNELQWLPVDDVESIDFRR